MNLIQEFYDKVVSHTFVMYAIKKCFVMITLILLFAMFIIEHLTGVIS